MFVPENILPQSRVISVFALVLVCVLILLGRFYHLQIYQHQKYVSKADANRIREVSHPGPRGLILDRYGSLLVDNRFTYMLSAIPWEVERTPGVISDLGAYVDGLSAEKIRITIREGNQGAFIPVRLRSGLTFPTISRLEEHRLELPGILLSNDPIRFYPSTASMAHILGYLREIDQHELNQLRRTNAYQLGDLIGWNGLERNYENILRGAKGFEYVQVNAIGQEIGQVPDKKPIQPKPGKDLYLSLDVELQLFTESRFDTLAGAVVVMNPENGEIYAFTSHPTYDLSMFSGAIDYQDWESLQSDTTRPLFNRGAVGTYPPGSTFKLITSIAALEENIVTPSWTVFCPGYYKLGRRTFKCWKPGGHGRVDMQMAIEQSCNVYFYNLIRKVGIDLWAKYASLFGFGQRTGVDLPEESTGILPDRSWMNSRYGENNWTEGNLLNMTVGQGDVLVTPLQMAKFAGMLATAGHIVTPHFGIAAETDEGSLQNFHYPSGQMTQIDSSTYKLIMNGMYDVVNGEHGTGTAAAVSSALVFGKTGTAQNPHGESHSWFIGIMKYQNDLIVLSVLLEKGGSGGSAAAPLAGQIFRKYIELQKQRENDNSPTYLTQGIPDE